MVYKSTIILHQYKPTDTALRMLEELGGIACLSGRWGQPDISDNFEIITAAPSIKLKEDQQYLYIEDNNGTTKTTKTTKTNGIEWLKDSLTATSSQLRGTTSEFNIPTVFGFIGYMGYNYNADQNKKPDTMSNTTTPNFCGGIYQWNLINDIENRTTYLAFHHTCPPQLREKLTSIFYTGSDDSLAPSSAPATKFKLLSRFKPSNSFKEYQQAFDRIRQYIVQGDCYQINYSHRHASNYQGNPAEAYAALSKSLNTPYSAYLDFNDHQVLSFSPERFIKVDGDEVETKPIKGTRPRGISVDEDQNQIDDLKRSTKDRAENLMIVDLLRNDLNKTCLPNSVKVPELFKIETYPNVHHLVSTITGRKPSNTSPVEVLKQAFPGGSITGAPKIRAMEIIDELETHRRSIYCGSIFYLGFDGTMDSNICIRTLLCKDSNIYCWGGGGIVADSHCEDEYQESITKVKNLMDELEKMSGLR
ncbi:aminodeoxychorismate synthase component I [Alkalimarinus coralli]|uniref:aminodeoxychorismate synthase component I n=1 Tax=Alkalimarinus coralli TaxID=2935863 RepID=UPI00202B8BFE|nr:aminodeoxychorismate synthase component I [Alkalimarinus coralli]